LTREVTKMNTVRELLRKKGTLRPRELLARGIPGDYLNRLHLRGEVDRVGPGLYALPDAGVTEHHSLAQVARLIPAGVICLVSALRFHGLTTQSSPVVWIAIPNKAWAPKIATPRLRLVRYSNAALKEMVEEHMIEKVVVKVYSPAKTVADCFKFRNKVGVDVALEALRDCWKQRKATMDELWAAAKVCRMVNVMRPYLESLV
jgi:predicted transcriptional regulator of viral defense system